MDCSCTNFGQLMHHVSTHISTLALCVNCSCTDLDMSSSFDGLDCPSGPNGASPNRFSQRHVPLGAEAPTEGRQSGSRHMRRF
ncbi:unnamed protein product [Brassica rapa subsp. narinosa]|nr:unnamed protein product [Brassica napus]